VVAGVRRMRNDKANFGPLSYVPWNMNPNWKSSEPVSVVARSMASVCGRSPAQIVGSNPTVGMDVCRECCVLSGRGLCDELITLLEES
jgi:hypothetical protein